MRADLMFAKNKVMNMSLEICQAKTESFHYILILCTVLMNAKIICGLCLNFY